MTIPGNVSGEVSNSGGASNSSSDSSNDDGTNAGGAISSREQLPPSRKWTKDWVTAMQEELNAFERNEDWKLMTWYS